MTQKVGQKPSPTPRATPSRPQFKVPTTALCFHVARCVFEEIMVSRRACTACIGQSKIYSDSPRVAELLRENIAIGSDEKVEK